MTVAGILGYLFFSVSMFSYRSEDTVCTGMHVSIADSSTLRFVAKRDVFAFLSKANMRPLGVRFDQIDEGKLETLLEAQPRIKKAECYKTPSGLLRIEVTQREPILRVMNTGKSYYVDREGKIMPVSENFTAYVPIVTGAVTEKMATETVYDFAIFLKENPFWNAQIEQIDIDYKGEVTLVPRVGKQIIVLGSLDNYEYKLSKLYAVYKNGFSKTGWNCYEKINLTFDNQVICTRKK